MTTGILVKKSTTTKMEVKASVALKEARKLLREKGWCKGALARNKYRHAVDPTSPSAVRFCAFGALQHVLNVSDKDSFSEHAKVNEVSVYLRNALPQGIDSWYWSVDGYNDSDKTTAKDIDKLFSDAIKLAKQYEGKGSV